ncbi:nuclear transport factor 2 family protein [Kribbella qitaiheensis]|uniref:Nuclear transport factor 2 family protein n=1 Tax=Kribbella qitaiheensis TaxID=1544730 RepID=A0A7G6X7M3_9ACTN|nr:nuclear transport factor 2 family protein [Kribbella qitaiheensis]QNE22238.1 nuclear transport factor 2 family protein [Kribbella qitaiheensis]
MTDHNRELLERLWPADGQLALSAEAEHELRTEDYVMEMPQSGERITGRDKMREMQREYPAPPSIEIQRIAGAGDHFVVLARSDYGGEVFYVANIVEFSDGRVARETRIYGSPFEAPDWRAKYADPS